jgi:hypothetical protein
VLNVNQRIQQTPLVVLEMVQRRIFEALVQDRFTMIIEQEVDSVFLFHAERENDQRVRRGMRDLIKTLTNGIQFRSIHLGAANTNKNNNENIKN